jgi:hypothetical protein
MIKFMCVVTNKKKGCEDHTQPFFIFMSTRSYDFHLIKPVVLNGALCRSLYYQTDIGATMGEDEEPSDHSGANKTAIVTSPVALTVASNLRTPSLL